MALADRFLGELEQLKQQRAVGALQPTEESKTLFDYGEACGVQLGLGLAQELFEKILSDQEATDGTKHSRARS